MLLPNPLSSQLQDFTSSILSRKIEIIHCKKKTYLHELAPAFFLSSTRFDFELTYKDKFKDNKEFLALKSNAKRIFKDTTHFLRDTIISVQKKKNLT